MASSNNLIILRKFISIFFYLLSEIYLQNYGSEKWVRMLFIFSLYLFAFWNGYFDFFLFNSWTKTWYIIIIYFFLLFTGSFSLANIYKIENCETDTGLPVFFFPDLYKREGEEKARSWCLVVCFAILSISSSLGQLW